MLPPLRNGHTRLFRVDNTPRHSNRPVEGLSGRWFSDDAGYVDDHYARGEIQWVYVDVPTELAEEYRYEAVCRTPEGQNLYGVEGKDFVLPPTWVNQRIKIDRPDEYITARVSGLLEPLQITEITSNVAKAGTVLDYNPRTGCTTVVERIEDDMAVILTKNRALPRDMYIRWIVPIRKVERL